MSPRPRRDQRHKILPESILETAWKQINQFGAASLSLRAIARELGITAPAIYNYYADRDALVTALIVNAFTSFGDAQAESVSAVPETDHAGRLRALGMAYREWAVTHPERYQLIFGTPISGYVAPAEITTPVAARSLTYLVNVLASAHAAGRLRVDALPSMTPALTTMLSAWQASQAPEMPLEALFLALTTWGRVHGLVALEIGNQLPPFITDAGEIYRRELEHTLLEIIQ
jgi:AcrR family transcriptional regulator